MKRLQDEEPVDGGQHGAAIDMRGAGTSKASVSGSEAKRTARCCELWSNLSQLWGLAFPRYSYANLIIISGLVPMIVAQLKLTQLPTYIGSLTCEMTGCPNKDRDADKEVLSTILCEAFSCLCTYVALRGGVVLLGMLLGMHWRLILLRKFHRLYLQPNVCYRVKLADSNQSFEQRITSDLSMLIKLCCGGVSPPLESVVGVLTYSCIQIAAATIRIVQNNDTNLLPSMVFYNIVTIGIAVLAAVPIASTTAAHESLEGDFRHAQMRVKSAAERIALLNGEELERSILDERLSRVTENTRTLITQYFRLELVTTFRGVGGDFFGLGTAVVLACTGSLDHALDVQRLLRGMGYFTIFSNACQGLPEKLPVLSTIAALSSRVLELYRALLDAQDDAAASLSASTALVEYTPLRISATTLSYSTPAGTPRRQLARAVSLCVEEQRGVVIRGDSGCGKSSLLRCIMGLWEADGGTIQRPFDVGRGGVLILPQRSYMCHGSLRQQVVYPEVETPEVERDAEITRLLVDLGLEPTLHEFGLDGVAVWEDTLSLGEQQRIGFARLLYTKPKFAIMDEATSALDLKLEAYCMQRVVDAKIARLTVAHRPSLIRYHEQLIEMHTDGTVTTTALEPTPSSAPLSDGAGTPSQPPLELAADSPKTLFTTAADEQ